MEIEKMEAKQTEEKQMQLNLNEIEARRLLHFVFIGYCVINGNNTEANLTGQKALAEKIYALYLTQVKNVPSEEITDNLIAGLRDKIIDETEKFFEAYNDDVLRGGF